MSSIPRFGPVEARFRALCSGLITLAEFVDERVRVHDAGAEYGIEVRRHKTDKHGQGWTTWTSETSPWGGPSTKIIEDECARRLRGAFEYDVGTSR